MQRNFVSLSLKSTLNTMNHFAKDKKLISSSLRHSLSTKFSCGSNLMASSSSYSLPRTWRYRVFTSFHGPDVRTTFLSHLRKQFNSNGISMFDDQEGMERSQTIAPELMKAIKESRISIVVLSKNYASSSWCLDELVEIFKCKKGIGQIVMTVFYGVDPCDVRKQTGGFGEVFKKTCLHKTQEVKRKWSQALKDASNIAGEHFLHWDKEADMIEKIARDVSNKLNITISRDFKDMVGIEAHLEKLQSLLQFKYDDEAMVVGICGPAGIGKSTIARALYSRLSSSFQLTCFMENISGSYNSRIDENGVKLILQEKLLSRILNQNGMRINHLGAVPERLCDQKVLIILDDVNDMKQLEALVNETSWFGPGSRIIVTTEDQELLEQHEIDNTYHVAFPTKEEAREIFCRYAFRQSLALNGFEKLVERAINLCSNLPLGLRVLGSSLRRKKEGDWEGILHRLENSPNREIDGVLRVGYNSLHKDDQFLFLLIACFLNHQDDDRMKAMLADSNLNVSLGLTKLAYKSLIQKSPDGTISMHKLLQQMAREEVRSQDPTKRQILIAMDEIRTALENDYDNTSVMGISLDISTIPDVVNISSEAFKRMCNLRFLSVFETRRDINVRVHVPEEVNFPPRLRLLRWEVYPGKCLPHTFMPEYLVEVDFRNSNLEKLWQGTQPLTSLKKMVLCGSLSLKELPNLSNATNLKRLDLTGCWRLAEIPSSIGDLHKLEELEMSFCLSLQVFPPHLNLASLESFDMIGCWQLRRIPYFSTNIKSLVIGDTMLVEFHESVQLWSRLESLSIYGSLSIVPNLEELDYYQISVFTIEMIPDCIKDLHGLKFLHIVGCPKLASLPELPRSIRKLTVNNCESLETVCFPLDTRTEFLDFPNCFKLSVEARRVITAKSFRAYLSGNEIPAEFDHRAIGNSLTIRPSVCKFRICLVLSPKPDMEELYFTLYIRMRVTGCPSDEDLLEFDMFKIQAQHVSIFHLELIEHHDEITFKFSTSSREVDIIECGVQVLADETIRSIKSNGSCSELVTRDGDSEESLSDKSSEFDEPRVKIFKGYTLFLFLVFIFLLSLLYSVLTS